MSLVIWRQSALIALTCCLPYLFLTEALYFWITYSSGGWLGFIALTFLTSPGYIVFEESFSFFLEVATQHLGYIKIIVLQVAIAMNVTLIIACTFLITFIVLNLIHLSSGTGESTLR